MSEEELWECEGCEKQFVNKKEAEKHEKSCTKVKMQDSELRNLLESINQKLDRLIFIIGLCAILFAIRTFV